MKAAVFLITILTLLIKIEAYAGQHGNWAIHHPYHPGYRYLGGFMHQEISTPFSFFAFQYAVFL